MAAGGALMKPDAPLRIVFTTATGCVLLIVLLVLALLLGYAVARAQTITVKTGVYQLDTGDTVHWWIDEERALLCSGILGAGMRDSYALSCLPLASTPYAWPALPE
jgi:hypothetical protein